MKAPFRKVGAICESMEQALKSNALQFDSLASLPGRIIALKLAIPGTRAWTRALYRCEAQARAEGATDEQLIPLTEEVREEFRFLLTHLPTWASIGMPLPPDTTDISICTDAGEFGYGGHSVNLTPRLEHAGALPPELVGRSSTCREFYALLRTADSFRDSLKGKKVLFAMDSQPLVHCLYNEGGKVPELVELFKQWILFCLECGIEPYYEWTPREVNADADRLSKRVPLEWSLSPRAQDLVRASFPRATPILPDLNQFANVIGRDKGESQEILLVHPVWPAGGVM